MFTRGIRRLSASETSLPVCAASPLTVCAASPPTAPPLTPSPPIHNLRTWNLFLIVHLALRHHDLSTPMTHHMHL